MRTRRWLVVSCLLGAALPAVPGPARAQIIRQHVRVEYVPLVGPIRSDEDLTEGDDSGDLRVILAELQGPRLRGFASAGVFGDVGSAVGLLAPRDTDFHELRAVTTISANPVVVNTFGHPVQVFADFILDGGELSVVGGPGSFASYELYLIRDFIRRFDTKGTLEVDALGNRVFTTRGTDIGAVHAGGSRVDVPLSFQSADLGVLAPGEELWLGYFLDVHVGTGRSGEIVEASFSDPFALSGHPVFGTLRFVPVGPTVVPEPSTVTLVAAGAVCLLAGARRQARGASPPRSRARLPHHGTCPTARRARATP